jgi:hypothetical protein
VGVARVLVSLEFLRRRLHFPATSDILQIAQHDEHTAELLVASPDLPTLPDPPVASPTFRTNAPVEFVSWGVEEKSHG